MVFAGRDLVNMAKNRPNVIPIIEDARHPQKYRMLVPMVDAVFADVAQPDQVQCCIIIFSASLLALSIVLSHTARRDWCHLHEGLVSVLYKPERISRSVNVSTAF